MSNPRPLRALVGARVSVIRDSKTSHLAQRETGEKYATDHGWQVAGYFNDLGVSATVSPWDRPDLGPWLTEERRGEWDVIVWSKVDRAFRSSKDCADVAHWAEQHGKRLDFTDDGIVLDYGESADSFGGMMAKFFLTIASLFGEMELRRFQERAQGAHRFLKTTDRWASGVPPLGYRTEPHPSGHGKTLVPDEEGRGLLHDMARQLMAGSSYTQIANGLNATGARTNMGRAREGKKTATTPQWTVDNVKRALTTLRTQGIKMSGDEPVLDEHGNMVRIAEPTFDDETWTQLQHYAKQRQMSGKRRAVSTNPILGVGYCGECGASLTRKTRRQLTYYTCGRTPSACRGVSIRSEPVHTVLEHEIVSVVGHLAATRQVFVPGEDRSHELAQVNETIARLRRESDAGLITTPADEEQYLARMASLVGRRDRLAEAPVKVSGWTTETEDVTYRDKYLQADAEGRRTILRDAGIRFLLYARRPPRVDIPEELEQRLNLDPGTATFQPAGTVTLG